VSTPVNDVNALPDHGLSWLEASGDHPDIVLSTRVRLARNLQGHAFGPRARVNDREAVLRRFKDSTVRSDTLKGGTLLEMPQLSLRTRRILMERRLVSRDLLGDEQTGPVRGAAVHVSGTGPVSVMVNEEDHLRVQSLVSVLRLEHAWRLVDRLDEELGRELPFAYHPEFGFLTSCPTNGGPAWPAGPARPAADAGRRPAPPGAAAVRAGPAAWRAGARHAAAAVCPGPAGAAAGPGV
jgi:protein arginine kinase